MTCHVFWFGGLLSRHRTSDWTCLKHNELSLRITLSQEETDRILSCKSGYFCDSFALDTKILSSLPQSESCFSRCCSLSLQKKDDWSNSVSREVRTLFVESTEKTMVIELTVGCDSLMESLCPLSWQSFIQFILCLSCLWSYGLPPFSFSSHSWIIICIFFFFRCLCHTIVLPSIYDARGRFDIPFFLPLSVSIEYDVWNDEIRSPSQDSSPSSATRSGWIWDESLKR